MFEDSASSKERLPPILNYNSSVEYGGNCTATITSGRGERKVVSGSSHVKMISVSKKNSVERSD